MRPSKTLLLMSALLGLALLLPAALGQAVAVAESSEAGRFSVAVVYAPQRELVAGSGSSFWLQGGGVDADLPLVHGFKIAAAFHGATVGSTPLAGGGAAGAGLSLLSFTAGPRFFIPRVPQFGHRSTGIFLESLFGVTHGFNSTFPSAAVLSTSANSFTLQLGGGIDLPVKDRVSIRLLQADYVRSTLPNASTNSQNGLRLGAGLQFFLSR